MYLYRRNLEMKKKASLLISGITTVAMLAVAVGSFAAWDTLTKDNADNLFSAKSGSPVTLAVTFTPNETAKNITLIPKDAIKNDSSDDYTALVGDFTPSFSDTETGKGAKISVDDNKIEAKDGGNDLKSYCDVVIYESTKTSAEPADLTNLVSGTKYNVELKLKDDAAAGDAIINKTLNVKLVVDASKK